MGLEACFAHYPSLVGAVFLPPASSPRRRLHYLSVGGHRAHPGRPSMTSRAVDRCPLATTAERVPEPEHWWWKTRETLGIGEGSHKRAAWSPPQYADDRLLLLDGLTVLLWLSSYRIYGYRRWAGRAERRRRGAVRHPYGTSIRKGGPLAGFASPSLAHRIPGPALGRTRD